jgi:hypothetical protein
MPSRVALSRSVVIASAVFCLVNGSPAFAVNRCLDAKGKVTYQDAACGTSEASTGVDTSDAFNGRPARSAPLPPKDDAQVNGNNPYGSARGAWRGPAQFQLSVGSVRDGSAQMVIPIVIELKETGEVSGVIPDAGCRLSGLATQFISPNMANVDVSLSGCRDARFDSRYSGMLVSNASAKEARLTLNSLTTQLPSQKFQIATLEAVLKR